MGFDANANLLTAEAEATTSSLSASSTREADSALSEQDRRSTEAALAPVLADLSTYGINPSEGRIGWVHPPERLEVEGYMQYDYVNRYIATIVSDFVVSGDISHGTPQPGWQGAVSSSAPTATRRTRINIWLSPLAEAMAA